jgi:iron(III) transport system permease protein
MASSGAPARLASALLGAAPFLGAALIALPLAVVVASLARPGDGALTHVWATTGPLYLANTIALAGLVAVGAGAIGVVAAALVALSDFPGRQVFAVALALPLAVPAYVAAYAYGDLFGPFGLVSALLGEPRAVPIRSLPGAGFVLALATYPYVYLAVRASLEQRSGAYLEAARALGASPFAAVVRTLLPAGRAAIAGGLALAMMEAVADYGVAEYFGAPTLSVGVFRTWRGLGDLHAATQLAAGLFLAAMILVLIEQASRRGLGAEGPRGHRERRRLALSGPGAALAVLFCALPVALGFVLPVALLAAKLAEGRVASLDRLAAAAGATLGVGLAGALLALCLAGALAFAARRARGGAARLAIRIATLGYALPGALLAVGIVAAAGQVLQSAGAGAGGLALLVYAYVARFSTAAFNAVDGGLRQIHPAADDAARALGAGQARMARRLHWPLVRPALAAGALVVLIDIARELPATLILRPFNFETLATETYRLASDERLAEAAPAALLLVAASLVPALLLERFAARPLMARD